MNQKEKVQVVSDLQKKIAQFKAIVLTNYRGLNVQQMTLLRKRLREEKISYQVVKNTLMKLASKGTDLEKLSDYFEGPTAIAIAYENPVSLARILLDFIKTQPSLEIKVGIVEGKVTSPDDLKDLASMPPREVLLAQILGGIQAPGGYLAGILINSLQQIIIAIQARMDQLSKSEGT